MGSSRRQSPDRIAIAAFSGWNDAGNAATTALEMLIEGWDAEPFQGLDPEDYHDFQVTRPKFFSIGPERNLIWPVTRLFRTTTPKGREVVLVDGIEPSMRWEQFCSEVLMILKNERVTTLIVLGALLADVPHTRPIPVTGTSDSPRLRKRYGLETNDYSGPTGIVGVLDYTASHYAKMDSMTLWAAVPHYVANPPNPKAVMALMTKIEEIMGEPLDIADLPEEARAWTEGVDALASEDEDIAEYVAQLEAAKDAVDSPDASGEALAREFQRYLHRRDQSGPGDRPPTK
ncbi:MAG: PAC2 family protein [Bifidobacteriaceae bacterium]|jgi:predicted ATP-grasp superfamily ATP-dependent carboligase|nr:PAC2 family protein [Bifidobacteriaceae bacterium]